jgi:protein involved in temperature-dependent protein secretion
MATAIRARMDRALRAGDLSAAAAWVVAGVACAPRDAELQACAFEVYAARGEWDKALATVRSV